jgi:cell division protein FtsI/penicillin-binding protein 2
MQSYGEKVGKSGIERVYENELQGQHGKKYFQRNARGDRRVTTDISHFKKAKNYIYRLIFKLKNLLMSLWMTGRDQSL